jgi:hypothetical protein
MITNDSYTLLGAYSLFISLNFKYIVEQCIENFVVSIAFFLGRHLSSVIVLIYKGQDKPIFFYLRVKNINS